MPADPPADAPAEGRVYAHPARVHLADAAPDGRARLDAVARWLQDAAYDDVADAGVADDGAWVVRRSSLAVERFPRLGEALALETWCDGLGRRRMWAQRRTSVRGDAGGAVEATALWVHVDAAGRPRSLSEAQLELWAPSTRGREVRARLRHPDPPRGAAVTPWTFRAVDLDVAAHVNNAAYWTVLEEGLVGTPPLPPLVAEIEHRGAAAAGPAHVARDGAMTWVLGADGEIHASIELDVGRSLEP